MSDRKQQATEVVVGRLVDAARMLVELEDGIMQGGPFHMEFFGRVQALGLACVGIKRALRDYDGIMAEYADE